MAFTLRFFDVFCMCRKFVPRALFQTIVTSKQVLTKRFLSSIVSFTDISWGGEDGEEEEAEVEEAEEGEGEEGKEEEEREETSVARSIKPGGSGASCEGFAGWGVCTSSSSSSSSFACRVGQPLCCCACIRCSSWP